MSLSDRQRACLEAMDLIPWRRRACGESAAAAMTDADVVPVSRPEHPAASDSPGNGELTMPSPEEVAGQGWDDLIGSIARCGLCPLHRTRNKAVPGTGNRNADWMIIGEAPGADEDRLGEPFVGRAGQLLDAMLRATGLQREQVYIANTLKCRPPNNRDPLHDESQRCYPYLRRQIELIQPAIILAVGKVAAQRLLDTDQPVGRMRGKVHRIDPGQIPLIVTYHPAYLLRSPGQKAAAWQDLKLAMQTVG